MPADDMNPACWVLLRGLTREARHWGVFPQALAADALAGKATVLPIDLPGSGEFFEAVSPTSVRGMVDAVREQLARRGQAPPYHLLAMSLGGMVAADWALRYPGEVKALVLVNTSMRPLGRLSERLRPGPWLSQWARLARLAWCWPPALHATGHTTTRDVHTEQLVHALTCQRLTSRDDDIADWVHIRQTAPVSRANAWRQLRAAAAFSTLGKPACPVLVLSSAADALVHPRCSGRLAAAWRAEERQHPWAGHDLPHDDAPWVCQQVAEWLASARAGAAPNAPAWR